MQGLNKAETAEKHGEEQVKIWRRSFDIPPPDLEETDERHPSHEKKYAKLPKQVLPKTEVNFKIYNNFSHSKSQLKELFHIGLIQFVRIF